MFRRIALVAATVPVLALASLSLGAADDDDTPFQKSMSSVNKSTTALRKTTRNDTEFKKSKDTISKNADTIAKVGKESREIKDFADKEKKPLSEWTKLMDEMTKAAEDLSKLGDDSKTDQKTAKTSFDALNKTCAKCHEVFKKD